MNRNEYYEGLRDKFDGLKFDKKYDVLYNPDEEESNKLYNCISYTLGFTDTAVWPSEINGIIVYPRTIVGGHRYESFWPVGILNNTSKEAFKQMYSLFGYEMCDNINYESEFRKIVIYGIDNDVTHAALVQEHYCMSKMGTGVIITHKAESLIGEEFGDIIMIMKRRNDISYKDDINTRTSHSGLRKHINLGIVEL